METLIQELCIKRGGHLTILGLDGNVILSAVCSVPASDHGPGVCIQSTIPFDAMIGDSAQPPLMERFDLIVRMVQERAPIKS